MPSLEIQSRKASACRRNSPDADCSFSNCAFIFPNHFSLARRVRGFQHRVARRRHPGTGSVTGERLLAPSRAIACASTTRSNDVTAPAFSPAGYRHLDLSFTGPIRYVYGILVAKGCAGVLLRTFRSANCVASRFASAHRQLIIVTMIFIDYPAGVTFYQGRIALFLVCQIFYEKWQRELASRSLSSSGTRTSRQSIVSCVEGMR